MNALSPGLPVKPAVASPWSQRVEDAVLLDALVQRAAELDSNGCEHGASIYGKDLNLTLSVDKTKGTSSPLHVAGTVHDQKVDLSVESSAQASTNLVDWQNSQSYQVHGTFGGQVVDGRANFPQAPGSCEHTLAFDDDDSIDCVQSDAGSVDSVGQKVDAADLQDLMKSMESKGYSTVADTQGNVTIEGTTVPLERLVFTGDNLPTVMEYRIGGSQAEITINHSQTRSGLQTRYSGNVDGEPFSVIEQDREFGIASKH